MIGGVIGGGIAAVVLSWVAFRPAPLPPEPPPVIEEDAAAEDNAAEDNAAEDDAAEDDAAEDDAAEDDAAEDDAAEDDVDDDADAETDAERSGGEGAQPGVVGLPTRTSPRLSRPTESAPVPAQRLGEVTLLRQARNALESNPLEALQRAEEHRRRFPQGARAEEREVIAIDALQALHRTPAARRRASAFLQRWPSSRHRQRLRELLNEPD